MLVPTKELEEKVKTYLEARGFPTFVTRDALYDEIFDNYKVSGNAGRGFRKRDRITLRGITTILLAHPRYSLRSAKTSRAYNRVFERVN